MSKRKVVLAMLHGPIFIKDIGQIAAQVATVRGAGGKVKDLSMELSDGVLEITVTGQTGSVTEVGVPLANVQAMTFAKPEASAPKK